MHVAIVTAFPDDPASPRGGVESVAVHLIDALTRLAHLEIDVVTVSRNSTSPEVSLWQGARVHRLPFTGSWTLMHALGAGRREVSALVEKLAPDLVHAHDTYGLMVEPIKRPRVLTIHGFIHADTALSGRRLAAIRAPVWRYFESRCWAAYPHIVSISPYVRERLRGVTRATIHDVENPIAKEFFQRRRQPRSNTIFSAAVISRRKNTLALIEAFALLRSRGIEAELRLAGEVVEPAYGTRVRERIAELGLDRHISLLGLLPRQQLAEELDRAAVFALVSLEENAPVGVQEAMAKCIPVVASNRCGMPYQVRDGETGFLVNPLDPSDIADRLATLLLDDELRERAGEMAGAVALDRFHPDAVARRTVDVYRAVAGVRRRPTPKPRILHF